MLLIVLAAVSIPLALQGWRVISNKARQRAIMAQERAHVKTKMMRQREPNETTDGTSGPMSGRGEKP